MMEHFYRKMRKRFDVLMEGVKPLGASGTTMQTIVIN